MSTARIRVRFDDAALAELAKWHRNLSNSTPKNSPEAIVDLFINKLAIWGGLPPESINDRYEKELFWYPLTDIAWVSYTIERSNSLFHRRTEILITGLKPRPPLS